MGQHARIFVILASLQLLTVRSEPVTSSYVGRNISAILDHILDGYDADVRPNLGDGPTNVEVDINVRSMGPFSERDMSFSMDCYFRQSWVDRRLAFAAPLEMLSLHIKMLEKLWKPDTYFYNGRQSYVHLITTPNKFLRIRRDGRIFYSMRLTIKAGCPMLLQSFPIDVQNCPLMLGSFAYTREELVYRWKYGTAHSVQISPDMTLSQFDLVGKPASNITYITKSGKFSSLIVWFQLKRHTGYYMIQVYIPCILIVFLSWLAFWLNREASADRVSLGVTCVLTLETLNIDTRSDIPQVPYITALDWYLVMCNAFVIATLLEFATVHFFTKYGYGDWRFMDLELEESSSESGSFTLGDSEPRSARSLRSPRKPKTTWRQKGRKLASNCLDCFKGRNKHVKSFSRKHTINSVSKIDKIARVLFPALFGMFNFLYWRTFGMSKK